jgi:Kef-type K+ transport system membrane component KefB
LVILAFALILLAPAVGEPPTGGEHPLFGPLLFSIAVLVLAAKAGGVLAERLGQPPVLGELLVGVGLGNLALVLAGVEMLAQARSDHTLAFLSEVGVLLLLFDVGLETNLKALLRVGPSAVLVALLGVLTPIVLGWLASAWLLPDKPSLVHLFVGATLSATSVGITARVLKDLEVIQERESQIILGAAILDDVLGLIVLAVVGGMINASATGSGGVSVASVAGIVVRAAFFLVGAALLGHYLSGPLVRLTMRTGHPDEALLVTGVALCFSFAFLAEHSGLAGIIGAFAAGVFIDPYGRGVRTRREAATLSQLLHPLASILVPLFFVLMGMRVNLDSLASPSVLGLAGVLVVLAIVSKLVSGLGVLAPGVNRLAVGIGMLPRGEVGLIFAGIGAAVQLDGQSVLSPSLFSAIVLVVLVTTLLAPAGLRVVFRRPRGHARGG